MIERRTFLTGLAGAAALTALPAHAQRRPALGGRRLADAIAAIERDSGGRLGVGVLDKATGARFAHRGGERFAMCSTFKFLLAAATLHRSDRGAERLNRRVPIRRRDIVAHSPVTEPLVGRSATVAQLCEATLTTSDNAAANLLLAPIGTPAVFTRWLRAIGDPVTRLDRTEPTMNAVTGPDPRDTTTPLAMTADVDRILLGNLLRPASRALLTRWMLANQTGGNRIRAALPAGWQAAEKTGTSGHGNFNDTGMIVRPGRAPILISVYLAEASAIPYRDGERIIERATRAVIAEL
jgi:beta-lactamase class A